MDHGFIDEILYIKIWGNVTQADRQRKQNLINC